MRNACRLIYSFGIQMENEFDSLHLLLLYFFMKAEYTQNTSTKLLCER